MWQQAKIVIHFWKNRTRFGSPPIGPIGRVLEIPTSARFCFSFTFTEFSPAEIFPCMFYFRVKQLSRNFSGAKINQPTAKPSCNEFCSVILATLVLPPPCTLARRSPDGGFSEECADLRRRNCSHTKRRFHKYVTKENETRKLAWALPTLW